MPLLLAIDTSAKPVSCALMDGDCLLGCSYAHTGATHSQTLMPMIENLLKTAAVTIEQLDAIAVNAGPGSFTGVRIGVSAVKGIAFTHKKPCVSVSTLEAMAEMVAAGPDVRICCVMDARCQQVYTALFLRDAAGVLQRLAPDEALSIQELRQRLEGSGPVIFVGDGSRLCYTACKDLPGVQLAPPAVRYQSAAGTATVAMRALKAGQTVDAGALLPVYLRLPQAERELRQRLSEQNLQNP